MKWPTLTDYQEAFQWPEHSFSDPDLRSGSPLLDPLGLPKPDSGNFATVYKMNCTSGTFAVKCFSTNRPDQAARYAEIADHLKRWKLPCMVSFTFLPNGIKIEQQWYPILKMEWVEGDPLDVFVQKHLTSPRTIAEIAEQFSSVMRQLQRASIAHGDLQHGNILVHANTIRLIDYDGMFVPGLQGHQSQELGHRNYQHPKRSEVDFGSFLDNFSAWSIYISLKILCEDSSILQFLNGCDECILLRKEDFLNPLTSKTLDRLRSSPNLSVRVSADFLKQLVQENSLHKIPFLEPRLLSKQTMSVAPPSAVSPAPASTSGPLNKPDASWIWDHMPSPTPDVLCESVRFERLSLVVLSLIGVALGISGLFAYTPVVAIAGSGLFMITASSFLLGFRFRRLPLPTAKSSLKQDIRQLEQESAVIKKSIEKMERRRGTLPTELEAIKKDYDSKCDKIRQEETKGISAAEAQLANKSQTIRNTRSLLQNQESDEIASAFKDYAQRIVQTRLQTCALTPGSVSGIGERFTAALSGYGISSAADILDVNFDYIKRATGDWIKIDGIGPVKAEALMAWRKSLENKFSPRSLPQNELDQIKRKFLGQLQDCARLDREAAAHEQDQKKNIKAHSEKEFKLLEQEFAKNSQDLTDNQKLLLDQVYAAGNKLAKMELEVWCKKTELARFPNFTFGNYLKRILWPKATEDRPNLDEESRYGILPAKTSATNKGQLTNILNIFLIVVPFVLVITGYANRSAIYQTADSTITQYLAKHGDIAAQEKLGFMYYEGRGFPKSSDEALKWFITAAQRGGNVHQAFMLASNMGRFEVLHSLIDNGADVNAKDPYGNTALIRASAGGQLATVKVLVDNGADVNARNEADETAVMMALEANHLEIVNFLVTKGADVNTKDRVGNTPLIKAAAGGQLATVKVLVDNGADVNARNEANETAVKSALSSNHLEVVNFLVTKGADVNTKDQVGNTPLIRAAAGGQLATVKVLVDNGADVNARNEANETAVMTALEANHLEIVNFLVTKGADVNTKDRVGNTPLIGAAAGGQLATAKFLVDKGANVNARNQANETAMMAALGANHLEVVNYLISIRAGLNDIDNHGNTVLMKASSAGFLNLVKRLVNNKADLNAKDEHGNTALMKACEKGQIEVARLLIEGGAGVHFSNYNGDSALMKAADNGHLSVTKLLIDKRANLNAKDGHGNTALIRACEKGHFQVAIFLLGRGVDVNASNNNGQTALMKSSESGAKEIVKTLIEKGALINARDRDGNTAIRYAAGKANFGVVSLLLNRGGKE